MSEIECAQLYSELFRRRHSTRQSHGIFALAKPLLAVVLQRAIIGPILPSRKTADKHKKVYTVNRKTHQNVFVASKITFSHLVVISIVDINTGVIFETAAFPAWKELQI